MLNPIEQAYQANLEDDPIYLDREEVERICQDHNENHEDYLAAMAHEDKAPLDAWNLYAWLGY